MLSPLPRRSDWDHSCSITRSYQPSPKWRSGRPAQRPFRGLLSVYSRYGLHTRAATIFAARFTGGFNHFVASTVAPVASGWSRLPGGTFTHWESAALTRRTPMAVIEISQFALTAANRSQVRSAGCQTAAYGLSVQTTARNLSRSRAWRASCPARMGAKPGSS